jgi:hypothetical protein
MPILIVAGPPDVPVSEAAAAVVANAHAATVASAAASIPFQKFD